MNVYQYWMVDPALRHLTAARVPAGSEDYWESRGVIVEQWKGGRCTYKQGRRSAAKLADYWLDTPPGRGILIDEMGNGDAIDEVIGEAIVEAKRREPERHIAVYTGAIRGPDKLAGLLAADLVLLETYAQDGSQTNRRHQSYGRLHTRLGLAEAVGGGIASHAIPVLRIGKNGITSALELRRQLETIRFYFPRVRGVAFFGAMPQLVPAINRGLCKLFAMPGIVPRPPRVWSDEPAGCRPGSSVAWADSLSRPLYYHSFATDPGLLDGDFDRDQNKILALPREASAPGCELQVVFSARKLRHYGRVEVGLSQRTGRSSLSLSLYRGDYEPAPFLSVEATDTSGVTVRERLAYPIRTDTVYRFRLYCESYKDVRAAIEDEAGRSLWDTGFLKCWGDFRFDDLFLRVRDGEGSGVRWDSSNGVMHLVSASSAGGVQMDCDVREVAVTDGIAGCCGSGMEDGCCERRAGDGAGVIGGF